MEDTLRIIEFCPEGHRLWRTITDKHSPECQRCIEKDLTAGA